MAEYKARLRLAFVKFPCEGCEKRYVGCHANCKEYKDAQEENKKIRLERIKATKGNGYFKKKYVQMTDKPKVGKKHYW